MIITSDTSRLARADTERYSELISLKGGNISAETLANIYTFSRALYGLIGRVDFWMLRSGQNVGTGNKLFSFHGVEGTLTNGPMWDADGILSPIGPAYISAAIPLENYPEAYFFAVGKSTLTDTTSGVGPMVGWFDNGTLYQWHLGLWGNSGGSSAIRSQRSITPSTTPFIPISAGWHTYYGKDDGSEILWQCDLGTSQVAYVEGSLTNTTSFQIARNSTNATSGYWQQSFAIVSPRPFDHAIVREVYKNTLGSGLSLP